MSLLKAILAVGAVLVLSSSVFALEELAESQQPAPTQTPQPSTTQSPTSTPALSAPPRDPVERLSLRSISLGYIDPAAPANQVAFRSDFGYQFPFPNRAEMFYAQARPRGPGLPGPERSVDFQDLTLHVERAFGDRMSAFIEGGARFLNPEVNKNTSGIGDMNVGFKYAFFTGENGIATFQFRTYIPTGDASRGLGTDHVSLEPGLLGFTRLTDRLGLGGELRYWIPVGGTDFAGSVLRYGLGTRYELWDNGRVRVAPTVEFIGWTVLGGKQSQLQPNGDVLLQSASGVTVVNVKVGARVDVGDRLGLYAGYGRALTGATWYRDVLRLEARWLY